MTDYKGKEVVVYYQDVNNRVSRHYGTYEGNDEFYIYLRSPQGVVGLYPLSRVIRVVIADENAKKVMKHG